MTVRAFWSSSIGKKAVMAVTGLLMVGFVVAHMIGNLQLFVGPEKFNAYSAFLQGPVKELVWALRAVLIAAVVLHAIAAVQLTQRSRAARPVPYAKRDPQVSTFASRTIRWGGVLLLLFIPIHILHFTTGSLPSFGAFVHGDVYANVLTSFRIWWVTLFYVVSMLALGLHLYHGAWSSVRSIGVAPASPAPLHRRVALLLAVVVWLGFTAVPVAVFLDLVR